MSQVWRGARRRGPRARGAAIAVVVVVLCILNMAILGSIAASAEDSRVGAMRIETLRAYYAAESGALVALKLELAGRGGELSTGDVLQFSRATAEFQQLADAGEGDDLIVLGRSGEGQRRLRITLATR